MMIDNQKLGNIVRKLREMRDWTQADLADRAGVASNTIALLERGERPVSMRMLDSIGRVLGVPGSCLVVLAGVPHDQPDDASRKLLATTQQLIESLLDAQQKKRKGSAKRRPKVVRREQHV